MRKILFAVCLTGSLMTFEKGFAQSFTTPHDTVKVTYFIGGNTYHNDITNPTVAPVVVNWKVVGHDFPVSWQSGDVVGICDNAQCRNNGNGQLLAGTSYTTDAYQAGTTGTFHLTMTMSDAAVVPGTHWISARLTSGATSKTVTWIVSKFPTGVSSVTQSEDELIVYPNPARNTIHVVFADKFGIRRAVVCNPIGQTCGTYEVSGNSAGIPLDNISSGVYLLRLLDAQGREVAIRRFVRE